MSTFHKFLIAFILCLPVVLGGLWLSKEENARAIQKVEKDAAANKVDLDFPDVSAPVSEILNSPLPKGAISDERTIHFSSREEYLAYLQLLSDSGLSPLGKIDSLLAIRVDSSVLSQFNPALHGGDERLSYRIEQPLPPTEINPELFGELSAFGASARTIAGGLIDGDGSGILVGILDSGIGKHPYFDEVPLTYIDLSGRGISSPGAGHGTAVASIVTGREGIAPAAELLVIRVLDDQGVGSSFDVAEGIVRAVDSGVDIINLSLGLYQDTQILREAVSYAQVKGVILVAAAGNDGYTKMPYPAAYPQVLSVTAVDGRGRQALFPNQSEQIDFAAPGVGVLAATEEEGTQLFSGTSAAAPFVTGTLAALLSADSALSSQEAVNTLKRYLDDAGAAGPDSAYGGGLLNWDRLRERDTNDIVDIALADIYLQSDAQPGTTMPIEVTVQNRGTRWLTTAELKVLADGSEPVEFTIGTLAPGQVTTRKVHTQVPSKQSAENLQIAARVLIENSSEDVRLENNSKAVFFKPIQR